MTKRRAYLKEPIIENQEQLDALPLGSVVIDSYGYRKPAFHGDVYRSSISEGAWAWWQAGPQGKFQTVCFPAKVLLRGTGPNRQELIKQLMEGSK
ncbi:hypothetical protein SEA_COLUCCI_59 [Arthrobacter phage Colucci]|uniref:Uncharacterized protein n=1 Tax=Arthrobacter phage Colucci TaxID=2015834 RepID=A0A286N2X1_9CAUD|nr:hypothetical protein FDI27_gp059 [Arthrobacter phage Colucci]ASX98728.1 hypothetical protein SEA_COLUCCI_59 [Arthrobacter phage Colucci]